MLTNTKLTTKNYKKIMDEQFFSPSRTIFHDLHMNRFKDIYREAFIII